MQKTQGQIELEKKLHFVESKSKPQIPFKSGKQNLIKWAAAVNQQFDKAEKARVTQVNSFGWKTVSTSDTEQKFAKDGKVLIVKKGLFYVSDKDEVLINACPVAQLFKYLDNPKKFK